jgi:hypothetical protein
MKFKNMMLKIVAGFKWLITQKTVTRPVNIDEWAQQCDIPLEPLSISDTETETGALVKKHVTASTEKGKLYLRLFNGRRKVNDEVEEIGFHGPVIGPILWAHMTYNESIGLGFESQEETGPMFPSDGKYGLVFHQGHIAFNGSFYGDWEIAIL